MILRMDFHLKLYVAPLPAKEPRLSLDTGQQQLPVVGKVPIQGHFLCGVYEVEVKLAPWNSSPTTLEAEKCDL